jgi:hypothetical protein
MKARITTVLSLTGVLVAGSAAALVNTQVLQNSSSNKSTATEISVEHEPESASSVSTVPEVSVSLPNKLAGVVGVAVTAAGVPTTQESFALDGVGTIVLDKVGDVLTIVSVVPLAGYSVVGQESSDPLHVEIKFLSSAQLVEFKASLMLGTITPTVETSSVTPPSTDNTTNTSGTSGTSGTTGNTGNTTSPTTGSTNGSSDNHPTTSVHEDNAPPDSSGHHGGGGGGGDDD